MSAADAALSQTEDELTLPMAAFRSPSVQKLSVSQSPVGSPPQAENVSVQIVACFRPSPLVPLQPTAASIDMTKAQHPNKTDTRPNMPTIVAQNGRAAEENRRTASNQKLKTGDWEDDDAAFLCVRVEDAANVRCL